MKTVQFLLQKTSVLSALICILCLTVVLTYQPPTKAASTFTVNSTIDAVDINPGNGICETSTGNNICTLRAAIQETNSLAGADVINLPAGNYTLNLSGADENNSATGDLDITDALTISGANSLTTIINANNLDRGISILNNGTVTSLSNLTIKNGRLDGTTSYGNGGGLYNEGKLTANSIIISNNNIASNSTETGLGGGVYNAPDAQLLIKNTTIDSNHSLGGRGGGLYVDYYNQEFGNPVANVVIEQSTISNNSLTAVDDPENYVINFAPGGGIFINLDAGVSLTNSTVSGNIAIDGAGIYAYSVAKFDINHSTISANTTYTADARGAGLYSDGSDGGSVNGTIRNSILFGNTNPDSDPNTKDNQNCFGTIESLGNNVYYNNDFDDFECTINESSDINTNTLTLGSLQNNGGVTKTHALQQGSAAIDQANNSFCPNVDQRGLARPVDGNADTNTVCDIGAYEYQTVVATPTSTPTPTATATPTVEPTITISPTVSPTPTPSDTRTAQVTGHLFNDKNKNGKQDSDEPNLTNVNVIIKDSLGEQTVSTDVNGNYTLNVVPGSITIKVDLNDPDIPAGSILTTAGINQEITVNTGVNTINDIGYYIPAVTQQLEPTGDQVLSHLATSMLLAAIAVLIGIRRRNIQRN
jgi:CSLREA domain-containing protein